jgi:membrane protease YdiL (CAAX protease family)
VIKSLFARLAAAEPAPPWRLTTVAITVIAAFVFIVVGTLIGAAWLGDPADPTVIPARAQLAGWLVGGLLTAIFVLQTRRRAADRAALHLGADAIPLPFVLFIVFGVAIALDLLSVVLTQTSTRAPELAAFNTLEATFPDWALAFVLMVAVQPVAEELVFRGVAWSSLRSLMGGWGGWLACAGVYATFHYLAYPPMLAQGGLVPLWYGFVLPLMEGLTIGAVRAQTSSTRAAMVAHAAFGLFAVVKLLVLGMS